MRIKSDLICSLQQISDCLVDGSYYWYCLERMVYTCVNNQELKKVRRIHVLLFIVLRHRESFLLALCEYVSISVVYFTEFIWRIAILIYAKHYSSCWLGKRNLMSIKDKRSLQIIRMLIFKDIYASSQYLKMIFNFIKYLYHLYLSLAGITVHF